METPIVVIGVTILVIVFIFIMYFHTAGKPDLEAAKKEDEERQKAFEESQKQNQNANEQQIHTDAAPADEAKKEEVDKEKNNGEKQVIEDSGTERVDIPEHCKIKKVPNANLNKYFFNVHEYVSLSGKKMYCIVCSACIRGHNYRIVLKNSYYPYLTSYTEKIYEKYISMFKDEHMSYEEFKTYGSENFDRVGKIIDSLFNLVY